MARNFLTEKEMEACRLYVLGGYSKVQACRSALGWRLPSRKNESEEEREKRAKWYFVNKAGRFFSEDRVIAHVSRQLEHARAEDIFAVGRAARELQDCIDEAREEGNHTAVSQLLDKKLKVMGLMRDRLVIAPEENMDDESLIKELSGGDEKRAKALRDALVPDSFGGLKVVEGGKE